MTEQSGSEAYDRIIQPACGDGHAISHNVDNPTVEMAVQTSVKALWGPHSHCTAS